MAMKKWFSVFAFLLSITLFAYSAWSQTKTVAPSTTTTGFLGELEGRIYKNSFFGFSLKLPDDGVILNQAEVDVYKNAGTDLLKGDNARNNKLIEDAKTQEVILLNYASKPVGSTDNGILVITARKEPVGATASMVIASSLTILQSSNKFELTRSIPNIKIGGRSFVGIEGNLTVQGQKVGQRLLVTIARGYAISMGIGYFSDKGLLKIDDIVNGLAFEKQ